ncbi:hypothetical protein YTCETSXE_CDS0058 [Staphylococcus phage MVC_VPHSA2]|uniref:Uncharacterized protein n=1 Tax=Staphylococcus phage MVC_VPHSA1 TaxID=3088876 RepID=A0ABZ0QYQ2_9CAUD|nr:hypothetical protein FBHYGVHD_CDS0077 [Staphylococcus phage MVC_VPHSA1]WPF65014.1 hypothetical protein YTCETSXE_CDS0058 [Staphylococcus phage MVC_VPHSA2]
MEKCNCKLCEAREFFTGFDKNGKYTGEVTETPSIYKEVVEIHHILLESGASIALLNRLAELADRLDELDTNLLELHTEAAEPKEYIRQQIDKLRGELY